MASLFHLESREPMQPTTNDSTVHWTESSTNSAAAYAFHMSDIFTGIDGKSRNPVSEDSDLLPENQARYYSMVVVLVLAGLFFGFTLTVTIAVGVFCRKKNTVFVFQKAEQDDAGYEMRGNDTEEDEDDVEEEDKEEGGQDDDWLNRKEEIKVKTGNTSIVSNASEPLFESIDSSDELQTHIRHKSLEVLDRRSRAPRSSGNLDCCFVTPQQKLLAEAQTLDAVDRDSRQLQMEVTKKSPIDGDPLFYRSQDSLDSSMDSSENTVIEVTSGGQFLPFRSSRVTCDQTYEANEDEEQSSIRGFSDDDYSADEEDDEESFENSFLCQYDSSFKPEMGVLLPEMKSQNRRQSHLLPDANIRHPEVRLLLQDVTIIGSAPNFRRTDKINDEGNFVIPQL